MSRDMEVLRRLSKRAESEVAEWDDPRVARSPAALEARALAHEEVEALQRMLSALEEKDTCPLCHQPQTRHPGGVYCPLPPKSSSGSMEERIRALLGRAEAFIRSEVSPGPVSLLAEIREALHHHQSWCRGDHSEGACAPEPEMEFNQELAWDGDPSEVDRDE